MNSTFSLIFYSNSDFNLPFSKSSLAKYSLITNYTSYSFLWIFSAVETSICLTFSCAAFISFYKKLKKKIGLYKFFFFDIILTFLFLLVLHLFFLNSQLIFKFLLIIFTFHFQSLTYSFFFFSFI